MSLTVPNAVIKMKQGVGRLIRNEEDKGIVLILDSRIVNKGYGNLVFSSLPDGYLPEDCMAENVPLKIERFRTKSILIQPSAGFPPLGLDPPNIPPSLCSCPRLKS